jgi:rRNA-processing protein FCF1
MSGDELVERARAWGEREGHDVEVVFEGERSADDEIAALAAAHEVGPLWVVTSDRELRARVDPYAERIIGGGSFVRSL